MIQFLSPLAALALLAISLPLALHLLSRKPGKTIKVGSLAFFRPSPSARWKSLKLGEVPLLLVRAALLAALAFLLARPVWLSDTAVVESPATGWVLVTPEVLNTPYRPAVLPCLDSLAHAGHELHLLAANFPRLDFSASPKVANAADYWSLMRELDQRLPARTPVWVIANDRLLNYRGERPNLHRAFSWQVFSTAQPVRWMQSAQRLSEDSITVVVGSSAGSHTQYSSYTLAAKTTPVITASPGLPGLEFTPAGAHGQAEVRLLQSGDFTPGRPLPLQPPASPLRVALYCTPQRFAEAEYIHAALQTAAEANRQRLFIQKRTVLADTTSWDKLGLVFWLSEDSLPVWTEKQLQRGLVLVTSTGGTDYTRCESWMEIPDADAPLPHLWRRSAASNIGVPLWQDGFGVPLLEAEKVGAGWHYRFASRFDPAWCGLVLHQAFPEWVLSLSTRTGGLWPRALPPQDQRRMSTAQALPQQELRNAASRFSPSPKSLAMPLWLLAALLFGLERWMSDHKKT